MRIAIVFEENLFDRKGAFLAKWERARHLQGREGIQADVFCVQQFYGPIVGALLGKRTMDGVPEKDWVGRKELDVNGVTFRMLWMRYSVLDHFLFYKLKVRPLLYPLFLRRMAKLLKNYDLVSAHSFEGGGLAREAYLQFGIPFTMSWHGSDIHTKPYRYPCIVADTVDLMATAKMNFFVSKALMEQSNLLGPGKKQVLYNGCDEAFRPIVGVKKEDVRVIAYVGSLVKLKNAHLLPAIFKRIKEIWEGKPLLFWIIGDGKQRSLVEGEMEVACTFMGDVDFARMPLLMNEMDLLVLPSRNEGLGMVLQEAIHCGTRAVGSMVGGIPESIGKQYCVPFSDDKDEFVENFARRCVDVLSAPMQQEPNPEMDWNVTARKEIEVYQSMLQ